jgi:hypothetical protein
VDHLEEVTSCSPSLYLVVTTGLVVGLVLLALAVARGRAARQIRTPGSSPWWCWGWTLLHVAATVGMLVAAGSRFVWTEAACFVLGTLGCLAISLACGFGKSWALLASAAAVHWSALGDLLAPSVTGETDGTSVAGGAIAYSVPASAPEGCSCFVEGKAARPGRGIDRQ